MSVLNGRYESNGSGIGKISVEHLEKLIEDKANESCKIFNNNVYIH